RPMPTNSLSVRAFEPGDLEAAAALLADRHRRHRLAEPLLDPAYEDSAAARKEIEKLLAVEGSSAWTAVRGETVAGYLVGIGKNADLWGPNVWMEPAGHAADHPSVVRQLYGVAAAAWMAEGRNNHHVLVPATDVPLVDAWFSLDFGQQQLHAVREVPPASFGVVPRAELVVRGPTRADIPAMAELELVLPRHSQLSPLFSPVPIQPVDAVEQELLEDFDNPTYTNFVAEHDGKVVGSATACDLGVSGSNNSLIRPASAGFLGYAAVLPEARGLGAGTALGETVLAWARDAGYSVIATDWRSTNLEADRSWRGLGFRPTFRRLHRFVAR
ncbi:MAG TPA: GNAT family N-acetyltransferase, partial [Candidatus Limnocylindrales bacterium]|nr:GNAT family N-acetyltransferase [Candidatus Limnocylindrales bacterium]